MLLAEVGHPLTVKEANRTLSLRNSHNGDIPIPTMNLESMSKVIPPLPPLQDESTSVAQFFDFSKSSRRNEAINGKDQSKALRKDNQYYNKPADLHVHESSSSNEKALADEVLELVQLIEIFRGQLAEKDGIITEEKTQIETLRADIELKDQLIRNMEDTIVEMDIQLENTKRALWEKERNADKFAAIRRDQTSPDSVPSPMQSPKSYSRYDRASPLSACVTPTNRRGQNSESRRVWDIGRPPTSPVPCPSPVFYESSADRLIYIEAENKQLRRRLSDQEKILLESDEVIAQQQSEIIDLHHKLRALESKYVKLDAMTSPHPNNMIDFSSTFEPASPNVRSSYGGRSTLPALQQSPSRKSLDMNQTNTAFTPVDANQSNQFGQRRNQMLGAPTQVQVSTIVMHDRMLSREPSLILPWEIPASPSQQKSDHVNDSNLSSNNLRDERDSDQIIRMKSVSSHNNDNFTRNKSFSRPKDLQRLKSFDSSRMTFIRDQSDSEKLVETPHTVEVMPYATEQSCSKKENGMGTFFTSSLYRRGSVIVSEQSFESTDHDSVDSSAIGSPIPPSLSHVSNPGSRRQMTAAALLSSDSTDFESGM